MTKPPKQVAFTQMRDGTVEDYALLAELEHEFARSLPDRIMERLQALEHSLSGYKVSRLDHSLQTATRAMNDGADVDWIVTALVHDLGDDLAPLNHDSLAAAILKPYVREECTWVTLHHGIFQYAYYGDKVGLDPQARLKYKVHPCYDAAVTFCERWDQSSFDPNYPTKPLENFRPMVEEVFTRTAWNPANIREGVHVPLTKDN